MVEVEDLVDALMDGEISMREAERVERAREVEARRQERRGEEVDGR